MTGAHLVRSLIAGGAGLAALAVLVRTQAAQAPPSPDQSGRVNPYADHNGDPLPPGYSGPRYRLNYRYPATRPATLADPPWRRALGGRPIGENNAVAYVQAIKDHIAPGIRALVDDYARWDPAAARWFDQPWLGEKIAGWPGREPIQGSHPGPTFDRHTYAALGTATMQDFVITYYNDVAAYTLHRLWQSPDPYRPQPAAGQFDEGAIVIKLTLTSVSGTEWAPMRQAVRSHVLALPPGASPGAVLQVLPVYAMQFDLIVKDRKTSPRTGWVFATLVYDADAAGATTWDRMVPLGAMWGNDPGVAAGDLGETVLNPAAPSYATLTLGWGGRLSGPNDGSTQALHPPADPLRISSCMACHGAAEFPGDSGFFPKDPATNAFYTPGTAAWNQWFQDRPGTVPQTPTGAHVALDYDMVTRQALINWDAAGGSTAALERARRHATALRERGRLGY